MFLSSVAPCVAVRIVIIVIMMMISAVLLLLCSALLAAPIIGIDLGTTYSCVAVSRDGQVEIIANDLGNRITPSWVAFTEDERLVGESAKNQGALNPSNTVFDVKRLIGRKFDDPEVVRDSKLYPYTIAEKDGKPYIKASVNGTQKMMSPEEISAMILTRMKQIAEEYLGEHVEKAVITVPAYFNDAQRAATKDAGRIAGLDVVRIINEPTAAAIAYGLNKKGEKNILVFDLGGGTFDVSILNIDDGVFEVKATNGDTHLGGEDFDRRVIDYFASVFKRKHNKDIRDSPKAVQRLRAEVERAKRQLSTQVQVKIEIESLYDGIDFSEMLTRAKFEELNIDLFQKTLDPVRNVLRDAKMSKSDIDEIVLVGGSTRIPKVQQLLSDFFDGRELHKSINPDEAVAYGAAVQGSALSGNDDAHDILLIDVIPLTLGIETAGGIMAKLIERNSYIPVKKSQVFTTTSDNQTMVTIKVYEGERQMTKDNNLLGTFDLTDIPPAPRGQPQIEVTFDVDANGILTVKAMEKGTGKEKSITIKNERGRLSDEDIERLVNEAKEFEEKDREERERIEARNMIEQSAYHVKSEVNGKNADRITEEERQEALDAVEDILSWLGINGEDGTKEEFQERLEKFNEKMKPILSKLYVPEDDAAQDEGFYSDDL